MPELPEVETVRRELEEKILDQPIELIEVIDPLVTRDSQLDLELLRGRSFRSIRRIGKLLQFFFDDESLVLLAHLKMTGQFLYVDQGEVMAGVFPLLYASVRGGRPELRAGGPDNSPARHQAGCPLLEREGYWGKEGVLSLLGRETVWGGFGRLQHTSALDAPRLTWDERLLGGGGRVSFDKHTQVVFQLENGSRLIYRDVRKFGYLKLVPVGALVEIEAKYGPDPLHEGYTFERFRQAFHGRKKSLKAVLMDQSLIAGLGNIYADEICHRVGIRPMRAASRLRKKDLEAIYEASKEVIQAALRCGGTTMRDFARSDGSAGNFAFQLQVYGRTGELCSTCGLGLIQKVVHIQRGTHFCGKCQL